MPTYEVLSLMIAFAMLVLAIKDDNNKKINHLTSFWQAVRWFNVY